MNEKTPVDGIRRWKLFLKIPCITADSLLQYFYDDIISYPFGGIPRGFMLDMQLFMMYEFWTKIFHYT